MITPGPWEVSFYPPDTWDVCLADGGDMIADLKSCPNAKANATAISLVPDMITALKLAEVSLYTFISRYFDDNNPDTSTTSAAVTWREINDILTKLTE